MVLWLARDVGHGKKGKENGMSRESKAFGVWVVMVMGLMGLIAATAKGQTMGPRGGCYIVVVSKKTGKSYKRYVDAEKCKGKGPAKEDGGKGKGR